MRITQYGLLATSIAGWSSFSCRPVWAQPHAPAASPADRIAQIVASPDRSAADRANDLRRKSAPMLAFIDLQPGMVALDLSAAGGYTTELLARGIGSGGIVYGQNPPHRAPGTAAPPPADSEGNSNPTLPPTVQLASAPRPSPATLAVGKANLQAAGVAEARIVPVVQLFEYPIPPALADGHLDLVTLMFNYHDLGHLGVDREFFPTKELAAVGLELQAETSFLRNPTDPRDHNTPDPPQSKDKFVLNSSNPDRGPQPAWVTVTRGVGLRAAS